MKINLSFTASVDECPGCGLQQLITNESGTTCRKCGYHCGSEFAAQWQAFVAALSLPDGVTVTWAHEGEPDDYYIDVNLDRATLDPRKFATWLLDVSADTVDIEATDIAALLADGKNLSANEEQLIDPLADILHVEGWGGAEDDVKPQDILSVVAEKLEWLKDQKADGIR